MSDRTIWSQRAELLLANALDEIRCGVDALPTISAAQTALRIECGELPENLMDGYEFPGESDGDEYDPRCKCGIFRISPRCSLHSAVTPEEP